MKSLQPQICIMTFLSLCFLGFSSSKQREEGLVSLTSMFYATSLSVRHSPSLPFQVCQGCTSQARATCWKHCSLEWGFTKRTDLGPDKVIALLTASALDAAWTSRYLLTRETWALWIGGGICYLSASWCVKCSCVKPSDSCSKIWPQVLCSTNFCLGFSCWGS